MKKCLLIVIALCSLSSKAFSQVHAYDNNHIGLSYSYYNPLVESMKSEGLIIDENTGTFGLDFTYGIVDRIALGMQFGYSHITTELADMYINNGTHSVKYEANVYQLWLKGDYHYSDHNFYESTFYSSIALGYMSTSASRLNEAGLDNINVPKLRDLVYTNGLVYQIYPIAYKREFRKSFGGFVELGYGYQGIVRLGLYVRIDRSGKKMK